VWLLLLLLLLQWLPRLLQARLTLFTPPPTLAQEPCLFVSPTADLRLMQQQTPRKGRLFFWPSSVVTSF
jgi:hypothetical protein